MKLLGIIDEDFVNYKKPCMVVEYPKCDFKCDRECGMQVCQNSRLALVSPLDLDERYIVERYTKNPITQAIVFQGLEPFDSWDEMYQLIMAFRMRTSDTIIIYTGYTEKEIADKVTRLAEQFGNIVIKFGRFIPFQQSHYDDVLGVNLASDNQYAKLYS